MKLDRRQKILVGILGGTLALFYLVPILWDLVFGPFNSRYQQIAALKEKLSEKETAKTKLELAERRLADADRRSLPSDPSSLAYQVWLTELANQHKFTTLGVAPKSSNRNGSEPFTRIRFTVTAHSKMKELCQFLYDFYRADLMHKVVNLVVKSTDTKSDPELDVTIEIEGLSMQSTKKRDSLFEGKQAQSVAGAMSKKNLNDYELLYVQNHFARGYDGPPKSAIPPAPPAAPFDSSPYVKYVGYVQFDGSEEAWLYDQTSNKNIVMKTGLDFEVAGVKATVVDVSKDFVTLKVKEKHWRLDQGDSLKQMKELGADNKPLAKPAATVPSAPAATSPTNPTAGGDKKTPAESSPKTPPAANADAAKSKADL
jgi:hypothetical protein